MEDESAGVELQAKSPLRQARIEVEEIAGGSGQYRGIVFLRPHFQLEADVPLRAVVDLPAAVRGDA